MRFVWFRELLSGCAIVWIGVSVLGFAAACLSILGDFRDVSLPSPAADDHFLGQLVQDKTLHPLCFNRPTILPTALLFFPYKYRSPYKYRRSS